jgi:hypothetical protein
MTYQPRDTQSRAFHLQYCTTFLLSGRIDDVLDQRRQPIQGVGLFVARRQRFKWPSPPVRPVTNPSRASVASARRTATSWAGVVNLKAVGCGLPYARAAMLMVSRPSPLCLRKTARMARSVRP